MLHCKYAYCAFSTDNRDTCKTVKTFFTGFGNVAEIRVSGGFIEVQRFDIFGNCTDEPFAQAKPRDVHRRFVQAARSEQLKCAVTQQVNRANLARNCLADNIDDMVELSLRMVFGSHNFVQAGQYVTG